MNLPNRWLYIDFNSYFASVEQQLNPALRDKPVAVVAVMTDATCAIAASYEAKAFGIKTGTPIWEAKTRCPGLICVLGRHERYVEYHHRAIAEVERHVHVKKICSIDEIACLLLSNESEPSRVRRIAQDIKHGLAERVGKWITCSIGIAPNRYLAKVATDMQKPNGLTFLNAEDLPQRLYTLKLSDLPGIGRNMERRINRQGIWTMQQLLALSPKQMRALWGNIWGERLWYHLRGIELEEQEAERRSVGHSHVLPPDLRPPEKARYVARRLVLKAASRLRRLGYRAGVVSLSLRIQDGPRLGLEARCEPSYDSFTFLHLLDLLWAELMGKLPSAVLIKKVAVTLSQLVPMDEQQRELFNALSPAQQQTRARAERLSHTLDRLNQRYGRDTVALGLMPEMGRSFSGTKIAFTRIPEPDEFQE